MILLDKVATKVHLTYDDGGENHKERVLVYIGVSAVGSQDLYFSNIICYEKIKYDLTSTFAVWNATDCTIVDTNSFKKSWQ